MSQIDDAVLNALFHAIETLVDTKQYGAAAFMLSVMVRKDQRVGTDSRLVKLFRDTSFIDLFSEPLAMAFIDAAQPDQT